MTGVATFKPDSNYRYKGLTLPIIGVYHVYNDETIADIYPIGSVEYKISLIGTEWEKEFAKPEHAYTVIHDRELVDIQLNGTVEASFWRNKFNDHGWKVMNQMFNPNGDKTEDDIYQMFKEISAKNLVD
jgi:hypothetical protein